jgi:hypothetical protein
MADDIIMIMGKRADEMSCEELIDVIRLLMQQNRVANQCYDAIRMLDRIKDERHASRVS